MDISTKIKNAITSACTTLGIETQSVLLEHPSDLSHGDFSTNIALVYSKQMGRNPRELGEKIADALRTNLPEEVAGVEVAGPGFINFRLTRKFFSEMTQNILVESDSFGKNETLSGEKIMIEHTNFNPFKPFHIGHVMNNAIGLSLARIIEWGGAEVKHSSYGGDVGLHVAKTIWGMMDLSGEMPPEKSSLQEKVAFLGNAYAHGSQVEGEDEDVKREVQNINKEVFARSNERINALYDWGKDASLKYFDTVYKKLGVSFDYSFLESEVAGEGTRIVEEFLKKDIFQLSDGAVVFPGEKYDLHTRVFINSKGLPTYEAKEIGLCKKKYRLYKFTRSIVVTANEQDDYFKVVLKALSFIDESIANKTKHISHGMFRAQSGKFSSRKGNAVLGDSFIHDVEEMVSEKIKDRPLSIEEKKSITEKVALAAIRYSILKQSIGRDIIFDPETALSFEGDSGPYLQYAHTRALSILRKAAAEKIESDAKDDVPQDVSVVEKLLYRFPYIVDRAGREYSPQLIVTYLIELASAYNSYYASEKIIDTENSTSPYKIALTEAFARVMKNGMYLLGIEVPDKM